MPATSDTKPRDLITIPELAELYPELGGVDRLYRLCRNGQLPAAIHLGQKWLVSVPKLERWLHGDAVAS